MQIVSLIGTLFCVRQMPCEKSKPIPVFVFTNPGSQAPQHMYDLDKRNETPSNAKALTPSMPGEHSPRKRQRNARKAKCNHVRKETVPRM